jgi:hypothetical protein
MSDAERPHAVDVTDESAASRGAADDATTRGAHAGEAVADEVLVGSRPLACAALLEITPEHTVGPDAGVEVEGEHVLSLRFVSRLDGYVGWFWTVTVARVDEEEPTVLEISLLPGDDALVAPEWTPWSERLADYRASQEEAEAANADADAGDEGEGLDGSADLEDAADLEDTDDLDESDLVEDELDLDDVLPDVDDDSEDDDSDDDESDDDDSDDGFEDEPPVR